MQNHNRPPNRGSATTACIAAQMRAQVARELPEPAGGFRDEAHRLAFRLTRDLRFFALQKGIQQVLDGLPDDDVRQMALDAYRRQSAIFAALHQARN